MPLCHRAVACDRVYNFPEYLALWARLERLLSICLTAALPGKFKRNRGGDFFMHILVQHKCPLLSMPESDRQS
jgi:hypothetical protein